MTGEVVGAVEPRIWPKPLRELTPDTSRGFEVIDFASLILRVDLYPWQQWVLKHALEVMPDGRYRYRRVILLVARQNGKSLLAAVLSAWWLFVESERNPDRVPPVDFKVLGMAQNLDIARGPWEKVKTWCDPDPEEEGAAQKAIPALQAATAKVLDANGKEKILLESLAHYETRAGKSNRGKPAARVLMDELREQETWDAWNSTSQTTKSFYNGQLWGFSNAGTAKSVVLKTQRDFALGLIAAQEEAEARGEDMLEWAANNDVSVGLFEYSAPDGCDLDDVPGILQANPSIGYGGITVADCVSDSRSMPEASYRIEVLCQWVTVEVQSYINVKDWRARVIEGGKIDIPSGARTVWGVDTAQDRSMTWVASATDLGDGRAFVQVVASRAGMMWLPRYMADLAEKSGSREVAVQSRGAPAMEFVEPLRDAGLWVHEIDGSHVGSATGRIRDRVRDKDLVTIHQPDVELAVAGGVTRKYAENDAWSRIESKPVDIGPLCAITWALYALETSKSEAAAQKTSAYADHDFIVF